MADVLLAAVYLAFRKCGGLPSMFAQGALSGKVSPFICPIFQSFDVHSAIPGQD